MPPSPDYTRKRVQRQRSRVWWQRVVSVGLSFVGGLVVLVSLAVFLWLLLNTD